VIFVPKCWTCGAHVQYPVFTCPACETVEQLQTLRGEVFGKLDNLVNIQQRGFETLSEKLSDIASILEWGFDELIWQIEQQTMILKSIDETLKTPSQTQAKEWWEIAEKLRNRGVYDESEKFFIKSVEANPLDYRTYIGLTQTYLRKGQFDKAKIFLEKSISHAPLYLYFRTF
jgi:tetratricopeptide (TPR) repeat protein